MDPVNEARKRYYTAFLRLPVDNPELKDIEAVCPHLDPEVAMELLRNGNYVCCPPLRVVDDYQVVYLDKQNARLVRLSAGRFHEYSWLQTDNYELFNDPWHEGHVCLREAQGFAKEYWATALIPDDWNAVYLIKWCNSDGKDTLVRAGVRCDFNDGKEEVIYDTFDPIVGEEMIGDRDCYVLNHCFVCRTRIEMGQQLCSECDRDIVISHFYARKNEIQLVQCFLNRLTPASKQKIIYTTSIQLRGQL